MTGWDPAEAAAPFVDAASRIAMAINADKISGGIHQTNNWTVVAELKQGLATHALDAEEVRRLRDVYVGVVGWDVAEARFDSADPVCLVADPGSGRRITAVNLVVEWGLTPVELVLDSVEDLRRHHRAEPGHGYVIDLTELTGRTDEPATAVVRTLVEQAAELARHGCRLVVLSPPHRAYLHELADRGFIVVIEAAPADLVLAKHLRHHLGGAAEPWLADGQLAAALGSGRPGDAVRMAQLVRDVSRSASPETGIGQVIGAYRNWSAELREWFSQHTGGWARALLLAAAVLEGAPVETVWRAADELGKQVGLEAEAGGPLVGGGVAELLRNLGAEDPTGCLRFRRTAYAASTLDHVWLDRPHLRYHLRRWLVGLPNTLRNEAELIEGAIAGVSHRHGDSDLVAMAARQWSKSGLQQSAVRLLTLAAASEEIGGRVRRQLYDWARENNEFAIQSTVARVCGGEFGRTFPQLALTRLRHLASRDDPNLRQLIADSLGELAVHGLALAEPGLWRSVLDELLAWLHQGGNRAAAARETFLMIASRRADEGVLLVARGLMASPEVDRLAEGLRFALRDNQTSVRAQDLTRLWLDDAARDDALSEPIVQILARTCRSSMDVGDLVALVWPWADGVDEEAETRRGIRDRLLGLAADRDPLRSRQVDGGGAGAADAVA